MWCIYEFMDVVHEIVIGIIERYREKPDSTDSYLLDAGKYYAMDKIKKERKRIKKRDSFKNYWTSLYYEKRYDYIEKWNVLEDYIFPALPEIEQEIFIFHIMGFSQREIANLKNINIGRVKYLYKKIKEKVSPKGLKFPAKVK